MKIKEALTLVEEIKPGLERLVSFVENRLGKKVDRDEVRKYIKNLDKADPAFIKRIIKRSKEVGNDGYKWSAIRFRALEHFKKELKK